MVMKAWDPVNQRWIPVLVDVNGILRTKPEGVYLTVDPVLVDEEQHRLRLTVDARLMTYDPVIDGKVDDIEIKLDDPATGLAAIEALVDDLETRLTAVRAGYLDELDFDLQAALITIAAYVDTLETRLTAVRAGYLDELDFDLQAALTAINNYVDTLEARLVTGLQASMTLSDHLLAGNIVRNPGFETGDDTGWIGSGVGSWSVQGVTKKYGSYAADLEPDAGLAFTIYSANVIPCYTGRRVRVQAWMKADVNIAASFIRIYWYDGAGAVIGYTASPDWGGNYDWTFRKMVATAPDEAEAFGLQFRFISGGVAGHGYVDSVLVPQAPMDAEIHEYTVHVSDIFPDDTNKTVTFTSGVGANAWGAWANIMDNLAATLSAQFAASDGYLAAIHIEDASLTDNLYMLEIRDANTGLILGRMRFLKVLNKVDVGHAIRIRSIRIPAGADLEYRQKDATGGGTSELHIRYYLV